MNEWRERSLGSPTGWRAAILLAGAITLMGADQPQWGQRFSRNMVSDETGLPDSFDPATGKNIKWKAALGSETYSTPVVARGRVLIGTNNREPRDPRHQGDRSVLMCFSEKDGRFLWQLVIPKLTTSVFWDWPNAGLCPTATVEGDRVYIVSNRGEVLCLDLDGMANGNDGPFQDEAKHSVPPGAAPIEPSATDGDILWAFDMIQECGVRQHDSAHSSILVHGSFLYVNTSNGVDDSHRRIDAPDAPSLVVLDKETGRWVARDNEHIGPRIFHSTWSSPALAEIRGQARVIFGGGDGLVYAFEPVSSLPPPGQVQHLRKVWVFDCDPGAPKENVHKYNSNRQVSPTNIKSIPVAVGDRVYVTAGGDVWWGKNEAWLFCIDATKMGNVTSNGLLWSYPLSRHCMSTPSVQHDLVFVADCGHNVHCVDAQTGRAHWVQETRGEIWASTLVADGKVYLGTRRGDFWVLAARREKQVLSTVNLDSPMHSSPVAANGVLYVASMRYLYAIERAPR